MGSPPALICRPSETKLVHSRDSSVPSNVSTSESSRRKVRERMLINVELSLNVRRAAVRAATGPEVKAMTAACGR